MTNETNPETASANPLTVSILHPLTQAAGSIHRCMQPISDHVDLSELADELNSTIMHEYITDLGDPATVLAAHMRTLDAAFNRLILQGFQPDQPLNLDKIGMAFKAQKLCSDTIDKLKKHSPRTRLKIDERNEGHEK